MKVVPRILVLITHFHVLFSAVLNGVKYYVLARVKGSRSPPAYSILSSHARCFLSKNMADKKFFFSHKETACVPAGNSGIDFFPFCFTEE